MSDDVDCQSGEDMFLRKNLHAQEKAIDIVIKGDHLKHGTKNHLYICRGLSDTVKIFGSD